MASSAPPMYTDTPLPVLHTPKYETGKTDPFTIEASYMTIIHNALIRGFNSIYQQAPRVTTPADRKDFVAYCISWHECILVHHNYEEAYFFPSINRAAGKTGLMDDAVEEHAAFHDGMEKYRDYLLKKGVDFSSAELIAIMDSFKDPLYSHLKSELETIVALSKHSTDEHPIDIVALAEDAGKKQMSFGFLFNLLPGFLLNMESIEFEDGQWHEVFPPIKGVVKSVMTKGVPMWKSGQWRFVSCSPDGKVKQLAV